MPEQPDIDTFFADTAFLEVQGSTATKVKAAIWAWMNLDATDGTYSLNQIRQFLQASGFEVVNRG